MAADEGHFRLWNPEWCNCDLDDHQRCNVRGRNQMTFEIAITEAASAVAELGTAADAVVYGGRPEVVVIVCGAAATLTTGDYFLIKKADGDGTETAYYCWVNKAAGGGDPAPGGTGIECAIGGADTAAQVGTAIQGGLTGTAGLTATVATATVTCESDAVGDVTDCVDVNTDFTITTTYQGSYQTAAKLFVASTDGNDIDATTGDARKVCIIGISVASKYNYIHGTENPKYTVEEVALAGATPVETERAYIRAMHMYCSEWGSGGANAKGDITLDDTSTLTGNTYLTIDTASNESNSSGLVYVADGYFGRWTRCYISMHDEAIDVT